MLARRLAAAGVAALVAATGTFALVAPAAAVAGVTICHRTHSTTNPYRLITVSVSAVNGSSANDHTHHTGAPFNPSTTYPPNAKIWGDLIPNQQSGGAGSGLNWPAGNVDLTTYVASLGVACGSMSAQSFYNVELEAGVPRDQVLADLADQGATGDPTGTTLTAMSYTGSDPDAQALDSGSTPSPSPSSSSPSPSTSDPSPSPSTSDPSPSPSTSDPSPSPSTSDPSPSPSTSDPSPSPSTSDPSPSSTSPAPSPSSSTPAPSPSATDPTPSPSTTEPTPSPSSSDPTPDPTQRIDGVVWLDLDRDGAIDPGESGIPGVSVDLVLPEAALMVGHGMAAGVAASVPVASQPTARDGSFAFPSLPAGGYQVLAHVPTSLGITWDSQGVRDGQMLVEVPVAGQGHAAVGLVGDSTVRLTGTTPSTVVLRWAGLDTVLRTSDDVLVVHQVTGATTVAGLPAGLWVVESQAGAALSAPVSATSGGTVTAVVDAGPVLASTGLPVAPLAALAAGLVVGGAALRFAATLPSPRPVRATPGRRHAR